MKTTPQPTVAKLLALAIPFILYPAFLHAQSEREEGPISELSPFMVSAERDVGYFSAESTAGTRNARALIDTAGAAAVINRELIDDLKATEVTKALNFGVSGVTSLDILAEDFSIRGFRELGHFRDGVSAMGFYPSQTYDLDRIEVIKGPIALSFGSGTILGGAVNLVSRKPTGTLVGELDVTVGERNLLRTTANVSGPLTEAANVRYRVTVGYQNDKRWKEIERDNNFFVGGALEADFGPSTVSLNFHRYVTDAYRYFNDFLDLSSWVDGAPIRPVELNPLSTSRFSPGRGRDAFYDNKETYFTAQLLTQLTDNLAVRLFYRFRDLEDRRRLIRGITMQSDNITLDRQDIPFEVDNMAHTGQVDVNYRFEIANIGNDLSFGADFGRAQDRQGLVVFTMDPIDTRNPDFSGDVIDPNPALTSNARNEFDTLSYYIQNQVSLFGDRLMLNAGFRWVESTRFSTNLINNTFSRGEPPTRRAPRYGIVYKPLENLSIYVAKAETVPANQGNNQRGEPLPQTFGELEEIGIKFFDLQALGGSFFGSVAYFDMARANVRVILPEIDPQTNMNIITTTTGDTSKGFEFDLGYRVGVGPGNLDALVTHYNAKARSMDGGRAVFAPDRVSSFLLKYSFNEGDLDGLSMGFGGYFEGDKQATANAAFVLPSKKEYETFVRYERDNWRVALNVSNLFNERRVERVAANGLVQATDPRRVRLTMGYHW